MTGEIETYVGTPAADSVATAFSRRSGCGARGSTVPATLGSSEVTDMHTAARPFAAIGARMSRSRTTRSDFVVIVTGWSVSASTSRIDRVTRHSRSIGWYGSVLVPSAMGRTT